MDKKLTQEELLRALDWMFYGFPDKDSTVEVHAYHQLREIVEWYFDNGVAQIVGDLKKTEGMDVKEILEESIQKHEQQKPTVTRAEIENAVGDTGDEYTEGVVELFESKGFEVVG